jgi:polyhydroxybutyrate depolymerase
VRLSSRGRHAVAAVSALGLLSAAACGAHIVTGDNRASDSAGSGGSVVAGAAAAPTSSPTPPPVPRTAARQLRSISFKGAARSFLYVTPKPGVPKPLPLLVVLHGRHADASFEEGRTGFDRVAAAGQAIVVYPNATGKEHSWNAGRCCDDSAAAAVDDVGFIDAVVAQVRSLAAIDPRRIYVSGYSTGAMMAYRYACARPATVAALAEVGGAPMVSGCPGPGSAVSLLAIHGTRDHSVPYAGTDRSKVLRVATPAIAPVVDRWRTRNACSSRADVHKQGRVESSYWSGCRGHGVVQFITLLDFDHDWPHRATVGLDATDSIWRFLRARSR